jgi:beta-glucanase (GH16 family)
MDMSTIRSTYSSFLFRGVGFSASGRRLAAAGCLLAGLCLGGPVLAQGFSVTVLDPGNSPLPLTVEPTDLIQDLKQDIFADRGYPVVQQVLVHDGGRLDDASTVEENNITTNDVLYVTVNSGIPLTISSIDGSSGTLDIVSTQMTAGVTQIIEQSPTLTNSPLVWWSAAEGLATSSGTNWNLAMPSGEETAFYRIRERDPRPAVTEYPGYELVWSDEFEGPGINPSNWWHHLGDGTLYGLNPGWGNQELQIYTNSSENSSIVGDGEGNSVLLIQALEGTGPDEFTSAKLVTDGLHAFRYGRIEARIRLPYSKGAWPAFWTLGTNQSVVGWPGCGEIDIIEMVGNNEDTVHGTVHYVDADHTWASTSKVETTSSGLFSDAYHLYRIDWTPSNIIWSVDGVAYSTVPLAADMKEFQRGAYLILNLAVGGTWPGSPDESSVFPMRMFVDYVRVYRDLSLADPGEPPLDIEEETLSSFLFDASDAIQEGFTPFQDVQTFVYSTSGGAPTIAPSTNAVDGIWSVLASYPGGAWGGMYLDLDPDITGNFTQDMSSYSNGTLVVALKMPSNVTYAEVKLESLLGHSQSGIVNLFDYPSVPINADFDEYTIPLAEFTAQNFDLSVVRIPFGLWNLKNESGSFVAADVLIDNIRFEP